MNILLISSVKIIGGGEHNLRLLATELSKTHVVTLVVPPEMAAFYKSRHYRVITYKFPWKTWLKGYYVHPADDYLTNLVSQSDICHAYCVNSLPLLRCADKTKLVWTCHGHWEITSKRKARKIEAQVGKVLFVSHSVYNKTSFIYKLKACIVYIGSIFNTLEELDVLPEKFPLNLICIGRFQFIKGQDLLIKSLMKNRFPHGYNVHFIGREGSKIFDYIFSKYCRILSFFCQNINKKCKIIFHGYKESPFQYVNKNNSIVVVPSRYESFSMVTVESLANGLPVIVPLHTGASEIAKGVNISVHFKPGDVCSLSAAINRCDEMLKISKLNGVRRAAQFHISKQAEQLISIYREQL